MGQMEGDTSRIAQFYDLLNQSIDVIRIFCDRIPGKIFQTLYKTREGGDIGMFIILVPKVL